MLKTRKDALRQVKDPTRARPVAKAVIVEDDRFIQAVIEARLARRNVETIAFDSIAPSRKYLARHKADFAIIDLGLPDGEGLELVRFIRQTELNKDMPIIIATSNRSDVVLMETLGRYRALFVSHKPIDWTCLEYVLDSTVLNA